MNRAALEEVCKLVKGDGGKVLKSKLHERLDYVIKMAYVALEKRLYTDDAYPDSEKEWC